MVISHVTIIADSALCFNAILGVKGQFFYIINRISLVKYPGQHSK